ncbi:YitT family protein [Robertkochia sediminum]|uniref:YitT family protein n=1 Tax=Robertkochia sediminum TaxID=2785326 RepID=UPI0019319F8E|nr:YitT family protein [Robertkochia sediminum]MBL7473458.1 YitT family protein [Robertkochia sediminum]
MNYLYKRIIIDTVKRNFRKHAGDLKYNEKNFKKQVSDLEIELRHWVTDTFYIFIGIASATFGLKGFLLPSNFIDGGVTGISLIVSAISGIPLGILIFAINLPFLILAYFAITRRFAIKSIIAIAVLSLAIHLFHFEAITNDRILVAAFGGFFLGLGIGMAIRGGAIIDGTEVLAIYLSRKTPLTVGNIILIFNLLIFLTAAYVLTAEIALYAILTYFAASRTVDFVIDGLEEYMAVTIISHKYEEVRKTIVGKMRKGCTLFKGQSGYTTTADGKTLRDITIVYTVITRLEFARLKTEIEKVDSNAFMVLSTVKDTIGGLTKKKPIHKIK